MAESLSEIFERILQKQMLFVERYHAMEQKCSALTNEKEELQKELQKQKQAIEKLELENQYLKIAKTIAPDSAALSTARLTIAKLVRDVEKCIEQLNE